MSADIEPPKPYDRIKVALVILFHSSCAIWSTLVSKSALNSIESPVLLLTLQFSVQVFFLTSIGVPMGWIKPVKPYAIWKSIIPLTLARMTGILAKTFCLASIDASFYQIARGLLLPFTLLLSLVVLRPTPYFPPLSLAGAGTVMAGFVAGMTTDFKAKLTGNKGLLLGVGSSFTTAVESVVVKKYLSPGKGEGDSMGVWQMVWMSNVLSVLFFMPLLVLSGETATLFTVIESFHGSGPTAAHAGGKLAAAAAASSEVNGMEFLRLAILTGLAGFLLTIATFMQIEVTSPTTHMIVTAARGVVQSALAVVLFKEPVTAGRVMSMALILGGSALYGWARDRYAHGKDSAGRQRAAAAAAYTPVSERDDDERDDLDRRRERQADEEAVSEKMKVVG